MRARGARNIGQLATRLRRLRRARGVTIGELAQATGVSRSSLYQYETDPHANPTLDTLLSLAEYYRLHSLEELFGPLPTHPLVGEHGDEGDDTLDDRVAG